MIDNTNQIEKKEFKEGNFSNNNIIVEEPGINNNLI